MPASPSIQSRRDRPRESPARKLLPRKGYMGKRWFVVQSRYRKQIAASIEIVALGFSCYVPMMPRRRLIGGRWCEENVPRFGNYIFAEFDPHIPGWQNLLHGKAQLSISRILCDAKFDPSPVPTPAIEAIKAYKVPIINPKPEKYRYQPGEQCSVHIAGHRQDAIFIEYNANRQFVRTWIFGAERTIEVKADDLEPLETIDANK